MVDVLLIESCIYKFIFLLSFPCIFRIDIQGSHGPGGKNQEWGYTWTTSPFRLVTIKAQYKALLSTRLGGCKAVQDI